MDVVSTLALMKSFGMLERLLFLKITIKNNHLALLMWRTICVFLKTNILFYSTIIQFASFSNVSTY